MCLSKTHKTWVEYLYSDILDNNSIVPLLLLQTIITILSSVSVGQPMSLRSYEKFLNLWHVKYFQDSLDHQVSNRVVS